MAFGPWGRRQSHEPPEPKSADRKEQFPCDQCGAILAYAPGTDQLACLYCGHLNRIQQSAEKIVENDLSATLTRLGQDAPVEETLNVKCGSCAAEFTFEAHIHAGLCPFCGMPVVADTGPHRHIKPQAVLPFLIGEAEARRQVSAWLRRLWFAPNKLADHARGEGALTGMYLPFWTYDSNSESRYTGQRGDVYYEPRRVTTIVDGKRVTKTVMVPKIRWRPASGNVSRFFDDVLVLASRSLPDALSRRIAPFDLENLKPYQTDFLSGFQSEAYQIGLEQGFDEAKQIMLQQIRADVRNHIGGDQQRIHSLDVRHFDPTFKHVLLPVWLASFSFLNRRYRFIVQGRTGEVVGERPYSVWKILLAVLAGLILIAIAAAVVASQ
ncbi:MAG: primosomal protein N' (replication factor Y) - superfamily II helicase [Geminicoccaceae bacterium]